MSEKDTCEPKNTMSGSNKAAIDHRIDHAVLREVLPFAPRRRERCQYCEWQDRQECEQVDQDRAPAKKVLLYLETKNCSQLAQPKRPTYWLFDEFRPGRNICN